MRRFISFTLIIVMFVATMVNSSSYYSDVVEDSLIIEQSVLENPNKTELPSIDLQPSDSNVYEGYYVMGNKGSTSQKLTFSNNDSLQLKTVEPSKINMISDMIAYQTEELLQDTNQAPISNPYLVRLNEEVQIDGQDTTDSIFFLFTRMNNTDLCYDPDGDEISMIWNNTLPKGYVTPYDDGANAGFFIQIFNAGDYPFVFAFVDTKGAMSQVLAFEFHIRSRGVFNTIDGELTSNARAADTYSITVDYSVEDEYYLVALRMGTSGFVVDVIDESGKTISTLLDDPRCVQTVRNGIKLQKPTGVEGEYTYTVKISPRVNSTSSDDIKYRIVYGGSSQKRFFTEGVGNAIDMPYYHSVRDYDNQVEAEFKDNVPISELGQYYAIDTIGPERVTLACNPGDYRFKILDKTTLETVFDSSEYSSFKPAEVSKINIVALNLNFPAGGSYYIVVYDSEGNNNSGYYSIMAGEPKRYFESVNITIPETVCTKGVPVTFTFTLQPWVGDVAYLNTVMYTLPELDWKGPDDTHYWVKTPGKSTWDKSSYGKLDYHYEVPSIPLTVANGKWTFQITPGKSGVLPADDLYISYYFEV